MTGPKLVAPNGAGQKILWPDVPAHQVPTDALAVWSYLNKNTDAVQVMVDEVHAISAQRMESWYVLAGFCGSHTLAVAATDFARFRAHFDGFVLRNLAELRERATHARDTRAGHGGTS